MVLLESLLAQYIQDLLIAFTDPKKRVFWGYLLAALLIALCWLKWAKPTAGLALLVDKKIWWSSSAKADYVIFLINRLSFLLLAPLLISQLAIASWLFESLHQWIGYRPLLGVGWPDWSIVLLFTFCYFLLDDFSRFYLHKLLHEVPVLWLFHKVHHSARTLSPITVFRAHPVEGILFSLRTTLVQAVSIALFVFFFGSRADLLTVLGAGFFAFVFNLTGANLRHSHIPFGYWRWLEKWLISPAQHQIHHSTDPQHFNKNYGVVLSIWDRLSGSLIFSEPGQQLKFGLSKHIREGEQNILKIYLSPFFELFQYLLSKVRKRVEEVDNL